MHKLLVAIDGSEHAARAADYAIELAKEHGVSLHFLAVGPEPDVHGEVQVYVSRDRFERFLQERGEALLETAAARAREAGVTPTQQFLIGEVPQTIVRCARENGCDAIVMGSHGMGSIGNLVMGSVAVKVVHLAATPVTLVK